MYIKEDNTSAVTGTANSSSTSLTLTTSNTSANVTVTPNNANGTFAMSSTNNEAKFSVTTNNYTGYELRIKADDDNGNLVNIDNGNAHTISSIPNSITKSSFDTTTYNNKWGYKPNKYLGPNSTIVTNTGDSAVFLPSPTTLGTVLDHTTTPNTTANNYTIALGIRADHNTYAGTYSKTFTLVATANPSAYTINYNKNTTDTVTNMPATQASTTNTTSITLSSTVPARTGYIFKGWCSVSTNNDACSGTAYNPNGDGTNLIYGIDQTAANTTTLYAMWELEKFTITLTTSGGANGVIIDGVNYSGSSASLAYGNHTISGSYASGYEFDGWSTSGSISVASASSASTTMTVSGAGTLTLNGRQSLPSLAIQNVTLTTCPTTATQVYDTRDNEIYTIQKLADGKCWLLDNLRLDLTNSTVKANLSATNTNASNMTLDYLKGDRGRIPVIDANGNYATGWTSSGYSYSALQIATSGSGNNGSWTKDTLQSYGSGSGKIGVYYNFCAASAGSYCYGDGTSSGTSSGNATEDICPKGWRMPTSGSSGEYQALYAAYSSDNAAFVNALRTPFSGRFYNGSANYQGSYGSFWSSTYLNSNGMYNLSVTSSGVYPQDNYDRNYGLSVRCVLQSSDISQISTMQDFENNNVTAIENSMTTGQAYTLTDSRDGETYSVAKLADGNVWLLDNLRLDLTNATVKSNLKASTTNASDATLNYLKNGGGTTSDQYATAGVANWTDDYSYSVPLIATSGSGTNGSWTKDTLQSYGSGSGKIGVYYNYCAASAGSYCYGDGSTSTGSPSGNATEDICPKGWRMPTGGSSGEYQALYTAYSSNVTNFNNALRTPLSGYFSSGSAYRQGSLGYFWSSTYYSSSGMYNLYVDSSYVDPQDYSGRNHGFSVRCVLQASDISQISTMQDFATNNATAIKDSMTEGQAYTLTDSRDGTSYAVGKLADGKIWLLDNLALDLTNSTVLNTLSTSNTNASAASLTSLRYGNRSAGDQYANGALGNLTSGDSYSVARVNADYKDQTQPLAMEQSGSGKIGVYYNYCAASAGSYCYGDGTNSGTSSGNATEDICPAGWRMPTSGDSGEYQALFTAYSSSKAAFVNALRTPLSGGFYYGSAYSQGSYGGFWSSTYYGSDLMHYLFVNSLNVYPQNGNGRYIGYSVRCVLQ